MISTENSPGKTCEDSSTIAVSPSRPPSDIFEQKETSQYGILTTEFLDVPASPGESKISHEAQERRTTRNTELVERRRGVMIQNSAMRRNSTSDRSQSSSFKKQSKMSKMLLQDDSSSDDDCDSSMGSTTGHIAGASAQELEMTKSQHRRRLSSLGARDCGNESVEAMANNGQEEVISLHDLSKVASPDILSKVKSYVQSARYPHPGQPRTSLATPELNSKNPRVFESRVSRFQSLKARTRRKVHDCVANLPDGESVNTFYLHLVRRRLHREVEALFILAAEATSRPFTEFDKNFLDDGCKSALIIAIDMKDESMIRKLLGHGVDLGPSIFHVIEADFIEGLKLILACDPCTDLKIVTDDNHFHIGMTPMLMAAHSNNYRILSMLYQYGHRLTELQEWDKGIQVAWESSNERKLICLARAQPAYITLISEINRMDPMKYCIKELICLEKYASDEREFSAFYNTIRHQYEDYMCSLLDLVSSSDELSDLFQFENHPQDNQSQHIVKFYGSTRKNKWELLNCLELLEQASRVNLVKFVTHQQSQLALSYLRYRSLPLLHSSLIAYCTGVFFPLWSLFYICAPNSVLGRIITLPVVSFHCHLMSDIVFTLLVLLQVFLKEVHSERLGQPVSFWELLILVWILGKWFQELQECVNRGWKDYFRDWWNYTDLTMLVLFSASSVIRIYDSVYNANPESQIHRYEWGSYEPRLIGEGMQAVGFVFLFLRLLGLMRIHRYLGPLQISLAKMLGDVIRFLCLFALVLGTFAFGLSNLYWYYGTLEGSNIFCSRPTSSPNITGRNAANNCRPDNPVPFTNVGDSIRNLFWSLFGLFELSSMSLNGKHSFTEYLGRWLLAVYHIVAIIVMLNMLIAMMSKSYDDTSENEDTAWKFHRTSVWIRFIRREVVRPPPMNLIPNPWRIKRVFTILNMLFWRCGKPKPLTKSSSHSKGSRRSREEERKSSRLCCMRSKRYSRATQSDGESADLTSRHDTVTSTQKLSPQRFDPAVVASINNALRENFVEMQSKAVLNKLVRRYKLKYLTQK